MPRDSTGSCLLADIHLLNAVIRAAFTREGFLSLRCSTSAAVVPENLSIDDSINTFSVNRSI